MTRPYARREFIAAGNRALISFHRIAPGNKPFLRHPGQAQREPGSESHRRTTWARVQKARHRRPDPGSPFHCVRDDQPRGEKSRGQIFRETPWQTHTVVIPAKRQQEPGSESLRRSAWARVQKARHRRSDPGSPFHCVRDDQPRGEKSRGQIFRETPWQTHSIVIPAKRSASRDRRATGGRRGHAFKRQGTGVPIPDLRFTASGMTNRVVKNWSYR